MPAEAGEFHRRPLDLNHKTCLTRIGLLIEGLGSVHGVLRLVDSIVKRLYMTDYLHIPIQTYDLHLPNSYEDG